ncbi:hypothetical protein [uncultured Oceanisphaera sp.]|uniref:hypothetical protein n=1 Tax=uncultured Oceanisphaera sp. TaxID=353858 RepID=UPI0026210EF9|nr:hypothetical protein [uncultured Oceanisphaera sp.]
MSAHYRARATDKTMAPVGRVLTPDSLLSPTSIRCAPTIAHRHIIHIAPTAKARTITIDNCRRRLQLY